MAWENAKVNIKGKKVLVCVKYKKGKEMIDGLAT